MADQLEKEDSTPDAGRGTGRIGAVAGVVPAVGLGALRVIGAAGPEATARLQFAGGMALLLIYGSPYVLT